MCHTGHLDIQLCANGYYVIIAEHIIIKLHLPIDNTITYTMIYVMLLYLLNWEKYYSLKSVPFCRDTLFVVYFADRSKTTDIASEPKWYNICDKKCIDVTLNGGLIMHKRKDTLSIHIFCIYLKLLWYLHFAQTLYTLMIVSRFTRRTYIIIYKLNIHPL